MSRDKVAMITLGGAEAAAQSMSQRLTAAWDSPDCPQIIPTGPDTNIEPDTRAVWIVTDEAGEDAALYERLDELVMAHVPTLLSRTHEKRPGGTVFHNGVVLAPPDLDDAQLLLLMRVLLSQAETIHYLHQELIISQRHGMGLRGQMDRIDEELRLAARVQLESLPIELPRIHDVDVHVMFRPAGYVSGDIYDVQRLDEDHIGLWLADVAGHGVPAALMTMFVKRALPTKSIDADGYRLISPDEALSRLNYEMFNRSSSQQRFATACYALINCRTHELKVARAGHPHPMLLRSDGRVETLHAEGPLLGVFPDGEFTCETCQLQTGDRLLLYSDGFETAFTDADDRPDTTRYKQEFARMGHVDPDEALAWLETLLDTQPGSLHQYDDLTVLMLSVGAVTRPLDIKQQPAQAKAD